MLLLVACLPLTPTSPKYQWYRSETGLSDSGESPNTIGFAVGNKAPSLQSVDQYDQVWTLHEQSQPLLLLFGHLDSNALPVLLEQRALLTTEVTCVTVVGRNQYSLPASTTDAAQIAQAYDIDVVLTDETQQIVNDWTERTPPKAYLLDSQQIVQWTGLNHLNTTKIDQLLSE